MKMPLFLFIFIAFSVISLMQSCQNNSTVKSATGGESNVIEIDSSEILAEEPLTAEQQAALTPDSILSILKKGNSEYINDSLTVRNSSKKIRKAALGQYPKAVILSCLDSRVPVEDVFHRGIGDIFVVRVAGNIINEDILGSLEFACKVSGSKLIVVLGHENCGAIKSAIDNVKLGNITTMLAKIRPAVESSADFKGNHTSANKDFVHRVCVDNIKLSTSNIRAKSPILKEMEANGEIKIVGAIYKMETGKVNFLN